MSPFTIAFYQRLGQKKQILHHISVVVVSSISIGLASCNSNALSNTSQSPQSQTSPTAKAQELQIVTTFLPITQFTKAVAGDRAQVNQLLPTNVGPHDYQAKPEDVQKLVRADLLIENGLEIEEFLDDLIKNASNSKLKTIDSSKGIKTLTAREEHHEEGKKHGEEESEHGEFDPHIWLDPKRVIQQVENIRDGLIAADPEGKEVYTANAEAYIAKLKQLDREVTEKLKPFTNKAFVTYHDFASYFAESYNLKAEFLVGIPEENPSPEDVKRVINAAQKSALKTLLTEPQAVGNPFSALAKDLSIKISNFDPLETADNETIEPDYYLTIMRQNVTNLETAFRGESKQSFWQTNSFSPFLTILPQSIGYYF
jgi:zinc/manganese transport system substrate-binding protein